LAIGEILEIGSHRSLNLLERAFQFGRRIFRFAEVTHFTDQEDTMYQASSRIRRASPLLAAAGIAAALGGAATFAAAPVATAASSGPCDGTMVETTAVMAEGEAMVETTAAMAEGEAMVETTAAMAEGEAMVETTAAMAEEGDVIAAATGAQLTTFVAAVEAAGLTELLAGGGPFTVFAPSDDAFDAFVAETGTDQATLLAESEALATLLSGHVVEAEVSLAESGCPTTLAGTELAIIVDGDRVTVGEATIVEADVVASNGVIHIVDRVVAG
jgi:uncharacterized surface protein with fasciclin (FAS1) repeats